MNKETENKKLEPVLKKLRDMEEALKIVDTRIDSFVVPAVGARVEGLVQVLINQINLQVLKLQENSYEQFRESIRFAVFFAALSVFVSSFLGGVASLVMAVDESNSLSGLSWSAVAFACLFIIASPIVACKYRPNSIKSGLKGLEDRIKKFYRSEKAATVKKAVSVFDGLISAIEQEIRIIENAIKREREKQSPNSDRLADLEGTLAKFKEQKAAYERSKREFGI